jgi:fused signal recognition particle receptor
MGVQTTMEIVDDLRNRVKKEKVSDPSRVKELLMDKLTEILQDLPDSEIKIEPSPAIILVVGVNGVGKTTSIGKMAHRFKGEGKKVLLAAGDTFRAAAIDQLKIWGDRVGVDVIRHQEESDPAAVIYDAIQAAKARNIDVLICDTAGRLHNKKNLMNELGKIFKVVDREYEGASKEILLVLDATTGQNALQQAKTFKEVAQITGLILTKLDGTAKGGVVVGISRELNVPVKLIGVGEKMEDLQEFNPESFVKAIFGQEE